jgi:hypothetical protein
MMMIRLLAVLGVFLFLCLWFLGADHGQYINPPRPPVVATAVAPQGRGVFVPAHPMQQAAVELPPVAVPALAPQVPPPLAVAGRVMHVPGGASIRSGPGTQFPVVGILGVGAAVMAADDGQAPPGWVRVVVDGQGQGWVAAKLLRQ